MPCYETEFGYICSGPDYQNYICFEHTTYVFEFSRRFGPAWFKAPGDEQIFPDPEGSMKFLWDMFNELLKTGVLN